MSVHLLQRVLYGIGPVDCLPLKLAFDKNMGTTTAAHSQYNYCKDGRNVSLASYLPLKYHFGGQC